MFREVVRTKQALSAEACVEVLEQQVRGVLALLGDEEYPYAVPINYYYSRQENRIYFHSGKHGHKMDAIARHNKASFCVHDEGHRRDGHWSLDFKSVIVFGKVYPVENWSRQMMIDFCQKFTDDTAYIDHEIDQFAANTAVLAMEIEHMTGKTVNEA